MLVIAKCHLQLMRREIYLRIALITMDRFKILFRIFDIKKRIERPKLARKVFNQIEVGQKYGRIAPTVVEVVNEDAGWTQNKARGGFRPQVHGDLHAHAWAHRGH